MLRTLFGIAGLLLIAGPACAADPPKVADLVRQLEEGAPGERVIAAEGLGDLGPAAADAIPALTLAAGVAHRGSQVGNTESGRANRFLYRATINALVGIGPKSAPALVELLPLERDDFFGQIAGALKSFGRDAAPAVPALAKLLADKNQDLRVTVARILEAIGPGAEAAVPDLIALFLNPKNQNDYISSSGPLPPPPRLAALRALIRIGPKGITAIKETALPVLAEELRTGEHRKGGSPLEVLSVLGETGGTVVPRVVDVFKNGEKFYRQQAGETLLALGVTGRKSFRELLASPDADVQRAMIEALDSYLWHERNPRYYRFEAPSLEIALFVPDLVAALKNAEPEHRLAAATVLCHLGEKALPDVAEAVIALYREPGVKKYLEAKEGSLRPEPRLAAFGANGVRALVQLLDSDSFTLQKIAIRQLRYAPRKWAVEALPRLRKLAEHKSSQLAIGAAYTATVLSLNAKDAAPIISRRFIQSADAEVRIAAANHLQWVGPLGVPHHETLIPLLDDKDDKVVQAAAETIKYYAPESSVAARALATRKLVQDPSTFRFSKAPAAGPVATPPGIKDWIASLTDGADDRRVAAAFNLGDKGADAKAAVLTLKKVLTDSDPDLRLAAGYALARIANDQPAMGRLLRVEIERATRGRPVAWVTAETFARAPADFPQLIPLVVRWMEIDGGGMELMKGLQKYGPKAKDAVPALRKVLRERVVEGHTYPDSEWQLACELLGAIGPDAKAALPELRYRLDCGSIEVALSARDAIQKITGGK